MRLSRPNRGPFGSVALALLAGAAAALGVRCTDNSDQKAKEAVSEGEEGQLADQPIEVAGAFLTARCSSDTSLSYTLSLTNSETLTACVLTDAQGARVPDDRLAGAAVGVVRAGVATPVEIIQKETTAPWHVGIVLDPVASAPVEAINIVLDGGKTTVTARSTTFAWYEDPLFAGFRDRLSEIIAEFVAIARSGPQGGPPGEPEEDDDGDPDTGPPIDIGIVSGTVVFVTSRTFTGDFGVAAADAACAAAVGAKDPARVWRAVLATPTETPRQRLGPAAAALFSITGDKLADSADAAWTAGLKVAQLRDEAGADVLQIAAGLTPPQLVVHVWTGASGDGTRAPGDASCGGWTSRDPARAASAGDVLIDAKAFAGNQRSCARPGRILCAGVQP